MVKIYRLQSGETVHESILAIARRERLRTARVEAIGTLRKAKVAYYNRKTKKYEEHTYNENMEVTSMLGNITVMEKKPFLHLHANLGRKDMSVVGGHLISAVVYPFLEVVITPTSNVASRRYDEALNLNAIHDIR